jgi:hypothetical protein
MAAPTGTRTLTDPEREGAEMNNANIKIKGARAIFQFLEIKTTARAPNRAGKILAKAGANSSDSRIGWSCARRITPSRIIIVVTMEETAMAMVEITSPSSVPGLTSAISMALRAQGTLRLVRLPVTKPRYEPPEPNMGAKVNASMAPTVQKMGTTPKSPLRSPFQLGQAS